MTYGLQELLDAYGLTLEQITEEGIDSGCCASICTECGATQYMEPDQDQGWCDDCKKNTIKSALILAGMI